MVFSAFSQYTGLFRRRAIEKQKENKNIIMIEAAEARI